MKAIALFLRWPADGRTEICLMRQKGQEQTEVCSQKESGIAYISTDFQVICLAPSIVRYCFGVNPVLFRNWLQKALMSLKPQLSAIADTVILVLDKRSVAT